MRIDDREVLTANLDDNQMIIGSNQSSLIFGGLPEAFIQTYEMHINTPLIGCLSDFQLNYE